MGRGYGKTGKAYIAKSGFNLAKKWVDINSGYGSITAVVVPQITSDMTGLEFNPDGGGTPHLHLTPVAQGTGTSTRTGIGIIIKEMYIRGNLTLQNHMTDAGTQLGLTQNPINVWIAIVVDSRTNGAQLQSEDVFVNPSGSASYAVPVLRNLFRRANIHVLALKKYTVGAPTKGDGAGANRIEREYPFEISFPKLSIPQTYSDTGDTIASVVDNSLHCFAWADHMTAVDNAYANTTIAAALSNGYYNWVRLVYGVRTRFIDAC